MKYLDSEIFKNISQAEYEQIIHCFKPEIKQYKADSTICSFGCESDLIGIVRFGEVLICRSDINGVNSVLETQGPGGIFGEIFYRTSSIDEITVICKKDCEIMFISYHHLAGRCERACEHHTRLVENMLMLLAQKAVNLSERIDILSRRSTREKLLSFFLRSCPSDKHSFTLPFSFSALADYLCVDRSAMMRELKRLKDDGIISSNRREITLNNTFDSLIM